MKRALILLAGLWMTGTGCTQPGEHFREGLFNTTFFGVTTVEQDSGFFSALYHLPDDQACHLTPWSIVKGTLTAEGDADHLTYTKKGEEVVIRYEHQGTHISFSANTDGKQPDGKPWPPSALVPTLNVKADSILMTRFALTITDQTCNSTWAAVQYATSEPLPCWQTFDGQRRCSAGFLVVSGPVEADRYQARHSAPYGDADPFEVDLDLTGRFAVGETLTGQISFAATFTAPTPGTCATTVPVEVQVLGRHFTRDICERVPEGATGYSAWAAWSTR